MLARDSLCLFPCYQAEVRHKYLAKYIAKFGKRALLKAKRRMLGPCFHLGDNPDFRCVWCDANVNFAMHMQVCSHVSKASKRNTAEGPKRAVPNLEDSYGTGMG
jgi:hypothetical protein